MTSGLDEQSTQAARAALDRLGEAELLALATSAPVGLFAAVDPHGVVLVNDHVLEITGRPRRALLGRGCLEVVHPDDRQRVVATHGRLEHGDEDEIHAEYRVVRPGGEPRWVRMRTVCVTRATTGSTYVGSLVDVTDSKRVETALRESESRFRALVERSFDIIVALDPDGTIRYVTPSAQQVTGYPDGFGVGTSGFSYVHPRDVDAVTEAWAEVLETPGLSVPVQFRIRHADGRWITLEAIANNLLGDGDIHGIVITARDVTMQRDTEAALRASEARLRDQASILEMIATSTPVGETLAEICRLVESQLTDARGAVLLVSDEGSTLRYGAGPSLTREHAHALDGLRVAEGSGVSGTAAARGEAVVVRDVLLDRRCASSREDAARHEIRGCWAMPVLASSDGRVLGTFTVYRSKPGAPTPPEESVVDSVVQLAAIAIERNAFEDRLGHQAHHDPLTGLPNRVLFGELLEHALGRAQRSGKALAVLFLDLDRFKVVNDSLGHDAGDELLAALARRLEAVLRPGDVVARFGGDEFTVLCEDLEPSAAVHQAVVVAERLLDVVREPVSLEGDDQFVSSSVGIALAFTGKERPEALLRDADAAMYRAKARGRSRCEVFDEEMRDQAQERHEIENALHRALAREELRVFFQPIVSLHDGACIGVEALLRWQHPERGLLLPRDFLDTAEETGLIVPIGGWLLEEACRHVLRWRRSVREPERFRLSVNLSSRQLVHSDLADLVVGVLDRTGVPPDALCIEITETTLMEDVGAGVGAVNALKAHGVRASIDDFGTGYSALGYLRQFPVDEVKIDRTFVERLGTDPEDSAIVTAVVSLGHALGVTVTGEGVETRAQLAELRSLGVDAAQGFLLSPPQPPADVTSRLLRPQRWF